MERFVLDLMKWTLLVTYGISHYEINPQLSFITWAFVVFDTVMFTSEFVKVHRIRKRVLTMRFPKSTPKEKAEDELAKEVSKLLDEVKKDGKSRKRTK